MKRQIIKKQFDNELESIVVSEELFQKTVKRISEKKINKYKLPIWLRSCAIILLASCLIFLIRSNKYKIEDRNNFSTGITLQQGSDSIDNNVMTGAPLESISQSIQSIETTSEKSKARIQKAPLVIAPFSYDKAEVIDGTIQNQDTEFDLESVPKNADVQNFMLKSVAAPFQEEISEEDKEIKIGDSEEKVYEMYENVKIDGNKLIVILEDRKITFVSENGKIIEIY